MDDVFLKQVTQPVEQPIKAEEAPKEPRERLDSIFEGIYLPGGYNTQRKIEGIIKDIPIDSKKEDEFISTLTEAVNDFSDKAFIKTLSGKTMTEMGEIINLKIKEVEGKFSSQVGAVEVAVRLSFNDNGYPMDGAIHKVNQIAEYLRSDEGEYIAEFNQKSDLQVNSFFAPGGEPGGYNMSINGEKIFAVWVKDGGSPQDMDKLSVIIKSQIDAGKITPRQVVDRFEAIGNDAVAKTKFLKTLKSGKDKKIVEIILNLN